MSEEKIDLSFLHNRPILATSLQVKLIDTMGKHCLEVGLGENKLRKKFKSIKTLRIFFKVLNNDLPVQMEFGQVMKNRIIRYIDAGQVEIYRPFLKEIKGSCMIIRCYDVFVRDLDTQELQRNPEKFW